MLKKLMPCIKGYKKETILAPITVAGEVVLEIFIPFLMAKIIDEGVGKRDLSYVVWTGALMVVMALLSLVFGALSGRFAAVASAGFAKNLRGKLFHKIQDFSFFNVDKFSTASLVTRLTTDVTNTQNSFMMIIRMLVRAPFMFVSATIMAVSINAELSLIFLVAVPILVIALLFIAKKAFPLFNKMLKKYDQMNASVQENLVAIRVVKAFVRRDYENEKFEDAADAVRSAQVKAEKILICNMPLMMLVMNLCVVAVVWFGGNMVVAGGMLAGELMSFINYIAQILMSLMMISMVFVTLVLSRSSAARIVEVLDEEIDIRDDAADPNLQVKDGSIEFSDVCFSYAKDGGNLALEHINLKIEPGETVGIIGGTGSAKTTLVQLIPRLYDVFSGSLKVGGRDVRDYKIEHLRDAVSMVLQKNVLFSGTIRENLKWGDGNASDEEIYDACRSACADEFIRSFPDGYDTDLGQGGVNVSGGQKQRLCIARALLKKPKIIILDDSTSAVDTATDASIRAAFREKLSDTTTIIIAQRISSVQDADKIIVMDEGEIRDIGTHEELLARSEIYREVYASQQKGAE